MEPAGSGTGSLWYLQRLSRLGRAQLELGLGDVIEGARMDAAQQGEVAFFGLARALDRARCTLYEPQEWESEKQTMEGYCLDKILRVEWLVAGYGHNPQLCLVAAQDLPPRASLVAARGSIEPVDAERGPVRRQQTWEIPGTSAFVLSQQELWCSNITRYCMRSQEMHQPANVEMKWEQGGSQAALCGVGVLTVLGEGIPAGSILYAQ